MEVTIVGNGVTTYVCNGREEVADVIAALAAAKLKKGNPDADFWRDLFLELSGLIVAHALEKRGEEDAAPQDTDSEAAE